ncbi:MAG: amino acid permease [Elusimicrobia bacterium]|nr:amino acid permease [Elusimicrobiota bacterium]
MQMELNKTLGFFDVFCLASGAMISSGIFILPGMAYSQAGPLVFVSYFLAGMLALMGTLSIIELATAMPKAGGDYFFITRSLGPFVGTLSSFLSWSALCLKSAFAVFGIAEVIYITLGYPVAISSFFICVFFVALNILGAKESAQFEVILVMGLFGIMLLLIAGGIGKIMLHNFTPILPYGINRILVTSGFVFISFGGLLNIAGVSGEVKKPNKNIPLGMILSLLITTLFYTLILVVAVGILPGNELAHSLTPIADIGRLLFGRPGYVIVSIGALLAFITTANAGILSASRYPLAMSKDNLLPAVFGRLTKHRKTPVISICMTGIFIFLSIMLDLKILVKLGSVVILTLYILTNISVIILREGRLQNYRPSFKAPFYPWLNILSTALCIILITDMGLAAVEISVAISAIAAGVYFFYGRKRHVIEYALLHLVERIINKKITGTALEEELKEVIIHRDELKIDRFHKLVEEATVIDIKETITFDDFLNLLAAEVSAAVHLIGSEVTELFRQREQEGSTALSPFVALPHIIIPGRNTFKLVIVRSRTGIPFTEEHDNVKAIFVLFGTIDERTFHLRVLAAIAHIVQNKNFQELWLNARDTQQLKDILLLSERTR